MQYLQSPHISDHLIRVLTILFDMQVMCFSLITAICHTVVCSRLTLIRDVEDLLYLYELVHLPLFQRIYKMSAQALPPLNTYSFDIHEQYLNNFGSIFSKLKELGVDNEKIGGEDTLINRGNLFRDIQAKGDVFVIFFGQNNKFSYDVYPMGMTFDNIPAGGSIFLLKRNNYPIRRRVKLHITD